MSATRSDTSGHQWEVVKSAKRKNAQNNNKMTKTQKKKIIENMPRVEQAGPIKETQTIFEAFLEHDEDPWKSQSNNKSNGHPPADKTKKNSLQQQKKKSQEKKRDPKAAVDEQLFQLTCEELESLLLAVQSKFPDTPSIWLKDLASYLNVKLILDNPDPVFSGKPPGYPTCILPPGIHKLLTLTIEQCSPQTLQLFFEHCLNTMVHDLNKGESCIGENIFLQCIGEQTPQIILNNIPKLVDLRNSYQNRHAIGMSILWTAGQVGLSNMKAGLEVWLKVMLPVLGVKAFTKYVIDYVDTLLRYHPNVKSVSDVLGVREFFPIMDLIHSSVGIQSSVQKQQLVSLYPKLKALSYGSNPENNLHNYFPSFLARLKKSTSQAFKDELLSCLVECLTEDKRSYSIWRQLYTKHLVQSSILLEHLLMKWDSLPSKFPRKLLQETLHTFCVTNEELGSSGKTALDGYPECVTYCPELLAKMSVWRFPWRFLMVFTSIALAMWVAYDINVHGSFQASQIGRALKKVGLLAVCEQAWAKITVYSDKSYRWLEKNVPIYYSEMRGIVAPYVHQFWQSVVVLAANVWESTQGARDWINLNVPLLLHWVNDNVPVYARIVLKQISEWVPVLQSYLQWIWAFCLHYVNAAVAWLREYVFTGQLSPDNLQRLAGDLVEGLQLYTKSAYYRVVQLISPST